MAKQTEAFARTCSLVAVHPTSPLSYRVSLQLWSVTNAEYRNGQAARSCRVALASSAVMLGGLFF